MRYSNLHTHTRFSDGAHTIEENIQSALELNMCSLGFSDHSFTPCDTSYCMSPEYVDKYLSGIRTAQNKYADRIPLYAGIELDYYSKMDVSEFDYVIASVHYINREHDVYPLDLSAEMQKDCINQIFSGNTMDFAKCYFDMVVEHVEKVKPTFVGHFDLINKFGTMPTESEEYRTVAAQALRETIKLCPYIEMNTGAISRGYRKEPYPANFLLDTIQEAGGQIVLSSDSHNKRHLIHYFDECISILRESGFDHISVFQGEKFLSTSILE